MENLFEINLRLQLVRVMDEILKQINYLILQESSKLKQGSTIKNEQY